MSAVLFCRPSKPTSTQLSSKKHICTDLVKREHHQVNPLLAPSVWRRNPRPDLSTGLQGEITWQNSARGETSFPAVHKTATPAATQSHFVFFGLFCVSSFFWGGCAFRVHRRNVNTSLAANLARVKNDDSAKFSSEKQIAKLHQIGLRFLRLAWHLGPLKRKLIFVVIPFTTHSQGPPFSVEFEGNPAKEFLNKVKAVLEMRTLQAWWFLESNVFYPHSLQCRPSLITSCFARSPLGKAPRVWPLGKRRSLGLGTRMRGAGKKKVALFGPRAEKDTGKGGRVSMFLGGSFRRFP